MSNKQVKYTIDELDTWFFVDCEFDGHNGKLLSIALAYGCEKPLYIVTGSSANESWVSHHVVPKLHKVTADFVTTPELVGPPLLEYIKRFSRDMKPVIVADSPVDIARLCQAITTGYSGGWVKNPFQEMTFKVFNVDAYPTRLGHAIQHCAYWDALALRMKLYDLFGKDDSLITRALGFALLEVSRKLLSHPDNPPREAICDLFEIAGAALGLEANGINVDNAISLPDEFTARFKKFIPDGAE